MSRRTIKRWQGNPLGDQRRGPRGPVANKLTDLEVATLDVLRLAVGDVIVGQRHGAGVVNVDDSMMIVGLVNLCPRLDSKPRTKKASRAARDAAMISASVEDMAMHGWPLASHANTASAKKKTYPEVDLSTAQSESTMPWTFATAPMV